MLDVTIKSFQSIDEVHLVVDGFTALVGRSNIGKSAVVRAVQSALTNALGTDFVRHGEYCSRRTRGTKKCRCSCSVHLKAEGFDLLWEKGDEVNQYTYNGQVYSRVDRGLPDFLTKDFAPVKVGDKKQVIQVAEQFEPIFLLGQSGTVVADVLSDVAKLDDINAAMSEVERDRREAVSTLKVRERDVQELRVSLAAYDGLDSQVARVRAASELWALVRKAAEQAEALDRFHARLQEVAQVIRAIQPVDAVEVPDSAPLEAFLRAFQGLLGYEVALAEKEAAVTALEPVEPLPDFDTSGLVDSALLLGRIQDWMGQIDDFKSRLADWKLLEQMPDLADSPQAVLDAFLVVDDLARQYHAAEASTEELSWVLTTPDLPDVPDPSGLTTLTTLSQQYTAAVSDLDALEKSMAVVDSEEAAVGEEWSVLGVCPTCSQPVASGHPIHA